MSFVSVQSLLNNIVTVHAVSSKTLRDAQIWSILHHIALAASGFSCFRHGNASRYSGLCTVTQYLAMDKLDKKRLDL